MNVREINVVVKSSQELPPLVTQRIANDMFNIRCEEVDGRMIIAAGTRRRSGVTAASLVIDAMAALTPSLTPFELAEQIGAQHRETDIAITLDESLIEVLGEGIEADACEGCAATDENQCDGCEKAAAEAPEAKQADDGLETVDAEPGHVAFVRCEVLTFSLTPYVDEEYGITFGKVNIYLPSHVCNVMTPEQFAQYLAANIPQETSEQDDGGVQDGGNWDEDKQDDDGDTLPCGIKDESDCKECGYACKQGDAQQLYCPSCGNTVNNVRQCPECGYTPDDTGWDTQPPNRDGGEL